MNKSEEAERQAFKPNLSVEEARTLRNSGEYEIPNGDQDYFNKLVMARLKVSKGLCIDDVVSELKQQNLYGKDGEIWISKVLEIFEIKASRTNENVINNVINGIQKKNEWPYNKLLTILKGTEFINTVGVTPMVVSSASGDGSDEAGRTH